MKQLLIIATVLATSLSVACNSAPKELVKREDAPQISKDEKKKLQFEKYFFDAKDAVIKGNVERAISKYEEALTIYPDNDAVMYEIGKLYFQEKSYASALEWLKKATKQNGENPWYWVTLGDTYSQMLNYKEAGVAYEKGAVLYNKQLDLYLNAANAYLQAGMYDECFGVMDKIEDRFGLDEGFTMQRANMYKSLGRNKEAVKEVRKLVNQVPNDPHFLTLLGETFIDVGETDSALKIFNQILKVQPDNGAVHFNLAELYRINGDKANYLAELQLAIKDPEFDISKKVTAIYSLMPQMAFDESIAKAVEVMADNFVTAHPGDVDSYIIKSEVLTAQKKFKEAKEFLDKALVIKSDDFNLWSELLAIDENTQDHKAMAEDSKKVRELFPTQLLPYATGCVANLELKNYKEVIEIAEEALVYSITKRDKAQFQGYIGDAYHNMGEHEKSDEQYEKVLITDPNNALIMNNYAYYLSVRGENLERAAELSLKSLALFPGNPSYMDTYGWILYKQGKYTEAEQWIKKSLQMSPNSTEVLEHYGDVLFKLGNVNDAVIYWQKAKDNGSDSENLDKKIANKKLYE